MVDADGQRCQEAATAIHEGGMDQDQLKRASVEAGGGGAQRGAPRVIDQELSEAQSRNGALTGGGLPKRRAVWWSEFSLLFVVGLQTSYMQERSDQARDQFQTSR